MSLYGSDAFSPAEIAARVEDVGVAKTRIPLAVIDRWRGRNPV